ncbi:MAG: GtrA family protein [Hyphomonadaceae bacterium]|nr:GtrA family protein [Hyphomonadaceae bacterium]
MPFEIALVPAHIVGMLVAFVLTRAFVFPGGQTPIAVGLKRFAIVNVGSLLITTIIASFALRIVFPLTNFTLFPATAAHIAGLAVASVFSYFGHLHYSFRHTAPKAKAASVSSYALFIVVCVGFVLVSRIYTLATPEPYNIDEAQWAVSARRILTDWVVWRSSDLTTSGPLNAVIISWPSLFGFTPSIISSRLTGILLLAFSVFQLARLVRRGEGFNMGAAAVAVLAAFLGISGDQDLIHYSSELFSVALIAAFGRLYVDLPGQGAWRWLLCGLIATSLPFAKLQSAIFCVLFHAACIGQLGWRIYARQPWLKLTMAYALGSAIPVLVLVAPAFMVGEQKAFLDGYLGLSGNLGEHTLAVFATVSPFLLGMGALWLATLVLRPLRRGSVERWDLLILSIAIWPVAIVTVWLPGRAYLHYAFYLLIALPLSILFLERALRPSSENGIVIGRRIALGVSILCVTVLGAISSPSLTSAYAGAGQDLGFRLVAGDGVVRRPLFAWTGASRSDRMLMWGWEPRLTAFADLPSADRASHAEFLIRPNRARSYFRERLLRDIALVPPVIVIDANRPGNFFGNFPGYRPENFHLDEFPALNKIIGADYVQIAGDDQRTAVYLQSNLAVDLRASEITLTSSSRELVDNAMAERSADWLDFDVAIPIDLHLRAPEPIQEIWVLSSRGGPGRQRGSSQIALDLQTADGVRHMDVALFRYPSWTVIPVDAEASIISFRVTSIENVGLGPALNEIKAFRTRRSTTSD